MVVGEVGKVRRFRISLWTVILLAAFLLVFITASVMAINQYLNLRPQNRSQEERIHQLEKDTRILRRDLERSRQYAALLEEAMVSEREAPQEPKGSPEAKTSAAPVPAVPEETSHKVVGIEDLTIGKRGSTLTVQFRLVKVSEGDGYASGHVHMIAMDTEVEPPQFWTYPKVALRDGVPIDYERGEFFKIQRFKMMRGMYYLDEESDLPSRVRVLVYNTSGDLMLHREFDVTPDRIQSGVH
jgi:hypothetical protein